MEKFCFWIHWLLQISAEITEYYSSHKSEISFYENYISNSKIESLVEGDEEEDEMTRIWLHQDVVLIWIGCSTFPFLSV
jgi:hypothetical protein